ncbi:MAG: TlpA family protein disulfide reductase [Ignavibacteriales bacterium]|nr:MAG: TlpA family protein disulfide reductase [Ignavibacteriales bacterium]
MKKSLMTVLVLFISAAMYFSVSDTQAVQLKGKKAPDFSLKDLNGKVVKLSDFKNKIIIIDFWATWCGPCRKGIPDLVSLQKTYGKDVVIIGITVDDDLAEVPPFAQKYGINYPVLYADRKVIKDYGGIDAIPTSFIVDKKGNIVDKHVGLIPKSEYEKKIKELM